MINLTPARYSLIKSKFTASVARAYEKHATPTLYLATNTKRDNVSGSRMMMLLLLDRVKKKKNRAYRITRCSMNEPARVRCGIESVVRNLSSGCWNHARRCWSDYSLISYPFDYYSAASTVMIIQERVIAGWLFTMRDSGNTSFEITRQFEWSVVCSISDRDKLKNPMWVSVSRRSCRDFLLIDENRQHQISLGNENPMIKNRTRGTLDPFWMIQFTQVDTCLSHSACS